jgi:hypothetical protein
VILIKQIRGEHRGDSDKANQRSYWNAWVILIKPVFIHLICFIQNHSCIHSSDLFYHNHPCIYSSDLFYQNHLCVPITPLIYFIRNSPVFLDDYDKTNQRSYWNTWVIVIKQIRGVNTGVILIKQIRGVNTGVILIKQIRGVLSQSSLYSLL